jgi:hypothetical protein
MTYSITARDALSVKRFCQEISAAGLPQDAKYHRGAVIGNLNKYLGGDDNRRLAVSWIFDRPGIVSSKSLKEPEIYALHKWIDASKNDVGDWEVNPNFPTEAARVLTESIRWSGTTTISGLDIGQVVETTVSMGYTITKITEGEDND